MKPSAKRVARDNVLIEILNSFQGRETMNSMGRETMRELPSIRIRLKVKLNNKKTRSFDGTDQNLYYIGFLFVFNATCIYDFQNLYSTRMSFAVSGCRCCCLYDPAGWFSHCCCCCCRCHRKSASNFSLSERHSAIWLRRPLRYL